MKASIYMATESILMMGYFPSLHCLEYHWINKPAQVLVKGKMFPHFHLPVLHALPLLWLVGGWQRSGNQLHPLGLRILCIYSLQLLLPKETPKWLFRVFHPLGLSMYKRFPCEIVIHCDAVHDNNFAHLKIVADDSWVCWVHCHSKIIACLRFSIVVTVRFSCMVSMGSLERIEWLLGKFSWCVNLRHLEGHRPTGFSLLPLFWSYLLWAPPNQNFLLPIVLSGTLYSKKWSSYSKWPGKPINYDYIDTQCHNIWDSLWLYWQMNHSNMDHNIMIQNTSWSYHLSYKSVFFFFYSQWI